MDEVCGCGRSPTGKCIDWHDLSEEEYQLSLKEYNARNKNNIEDKDNNVKEQKLCFWFKKKLPSGSFFLDTIKFSNHSQIFYDSFSSKIS